MQFQADAGCALAHPQHALEVAHVHHRQALVEQDGLAELLELPARKNPVGALLGRKRQPGDRPAVGRLGKFRMREGEERTVTVPRLVDAEQAELPGIGDHAETLAIADRREPRPARDRLLDCGYDRLDHRCRSRRQLRGQW